MGKSPTRLIAGLALALLATPAAADGFGYPIGGPYILGYGAILYCRPTGGCRSQPYFTPDVAPAPPIVVGVPDYPLPPRDKYQFNRRPPVAPEQPQ